jgi:soluble lytic murein transglycosylase
MEYFIYALIYAESGFNPTAGSSAGARGLMQLMPGTAQGVAQQLGIEYEPNKITDPHYNMKLGIKYISDQVKNRNGDLVMALASYNAGPGAVNKWISEGWVSTDINGIPYRETRAYVPRVLAVMQVYKEMF